MSRIQLQDIPGIPEGITSEGLLAVLFLVLLGVIGASLALRGGYLRLGKNGDTNHSAQHAAQTDRLIQAITDKTEVMAELVASNRELADQVRTLRANLYDRMGPSISGLSLAYLRLADLAKLADREEKREQKEGWPPAVPPAE